MKTFSVLICLLLQVITVYSGTCASFTGCDAATQNLVPAAIGTTADVCCLDKPTCAQFEGIQAFADYCVNATDSTELKFLSDATTQCTGTYYCDITEGSDDWNLCCTSSEEAEPHVWESEMTDSEAQVSLVVCIIIFAIMWVCGAGFFCYYCQNEPQRMYTDKEKAENEDKKKRHKKDEEEGSSEEESS